MSHTYALGAVKPWVKDAAYEIGNKFDIATIYGVGARAGQSEHPLGLATDFMVYTDRAKGDNIAAYIKQNWQRLDIKYMIWYQRIDEGSGFTPMEDRGGTTANHKDHVHVSYLSTAGAGGSYSGNTTDDTGGTATSTDSGGGGGVSAAISAVTSAATWIRVLEFIAGAVILAIVAFEVVTSA
jgi:hypothetical protein